MCVCKNEGERGGMLIAWSRNETSVILGRTTSRNTSPVLDTRLGIAVPLARRRVHRLAPRRTHAQRSPRRSEDKTNRRPSSYRNRLGATFPRAHYRADKGIYIVSESRQAYWVTREPVRNGGGEMQAQSSTKETYKR